MKKQNYFFLTGTIFAIVFVLHGLRLINGWSVEIGTWTAPMWLSWVGLVLAGWLAWSAFKGNKR